MEPHTWLLSDELLWVDVQSSSAPVSVHIDHLVLKFFFANAKKIYVQSTSYLETREGQRNDAALEAIEGASKPPNFSRPLPCHPTHDSIHPVCEPEHTQSKPKWYEGRTIKNLFGRVKEKLIPV
jgi:hypothetical protein